MVKQALVGRVLEVLVKIAVELVDHPFQILHAGSLIVMRPSRLFDEFLNAIVQGLDLSEEQLVGLLQTFVVCGKCINLISHFCVEHIPRILRHRYAL